jgi:hypothetical protein
VPPHKAAFGRKWRRRARVGGGVGRRARVCRHVRRARTQEVATTACSSPTQLPPKLVPIAKLSDDVAAHALRAAVLSTVSPSSDGPLSFDVWPAEKAELRAAALTPNGELTVPARNCAVAACPWAP